MIDACPSSLRSEAAAAAAVAAGCWLLAPWGQAAYLRLWHGLQLRVRGRCCVPRAPSMGPTSVRGAPRLRAAAPGHRRRPSSPPPCFQPAGSCLNRQGKGPARRAGERRAVRAELAVERRTADGRLAAAGVGARVGVRGERGRQAGAGAASRRTVALAIPATTCGFFYFPSAPSLVGSSLSLTPPPGLRGLRCIST